MTSSLRRFLVTVTFALAFVLMAFGQTKQQASGKTEFRILFVGNSLTYTNNLPALVEKSAGEKGIELKTEMLALPNYALIDHWNDKIVQEKIKTGAFDFVVVQQGPSSQPEGRQLLLEAGGKFSKLCLENGSRLCFFMVWPSLEYYQTFDGVIDNYREVSEMHNALLCPVGEAWKAHFEQSHNFDYYGPDDFHPSLKGSRVAADIIVASLFN